MTRVKLGGRELSIADELVTEYTAKGYSVIDARGNVLQSGKASTYEQLVIENKNLIATNKKLLDRIKALESQENEILAKFAELKDKLELGDKQDDNSQTYGGLSDSSDKSDIAERFKCPHCDKDYATKENLNKHISTAHKDKDADNGNDSE